MTHPATPTDAPATPRRQRRATADTGMTLIELVVAMAVMSIVLTMVTGAIVVMYRSTAKVEGITTTSAQVSIALTKLDSSVRYADDIGDPVTDSSGNWYLIYRTTYDGVSDCTQLRFAVAARQLQNRTWTAGQSAPPGHWTPLASQLTLSADGGGTAPPFIVATSRDANLSDVAVHQQLRLRFSAVTGTGASQTVSATDVTFTAFNANINRPLERAGGPQLATCTAGVTP